MYKGRYNKDGRLQKGLEDTRMMKIYENNGGKQVGQEDTIRIGRYENQSIKVLEISILMNLTHSFYLGLIEVAL